MDLNIPPRWCHQLIICGPGWIRIPPLDGTDQKAVSMNLMHSNLSITDGVYRIVAVDVVGMWIAHMGQVDNITNMPLFELTNQLTRIENIL